MIFPSGHPYYKAHKKRKSAIEGKVDEQGREYSWWKKKPTPPDPKKLSERVPLGEKLEAIPNAPFIYVNRDDPQKAMFIKAAQEVSKVIDFSRFEKAISLITYDISDEEPTVGMFDPTIKHALRIFIDPVYGKNDILTVFHELGHFWDYLNNYPSLDRENRKMNAFFKAAENSEAFQNILKRHNAAKSTLKLLKEGTDEYTKVKDKIEYLAYLNTPKEVFARAFAQYVAQKTKNIDALKIVLKDADKDEQWSEDDFKALKKHLKTFLK